MHSTTRFRVKNTRNTEPVVSTGDHDSKKSPPATDYDLAFQNLFGRISLGLYQTDSLGNCRTDGLSARKLIAEDVVASFARVHPEDLPSVASAWRSAMELGLEWSRQLRCLTAGGALCWIHATIRELRGGNGAPAGYLGCNIDITARVEESNELTVSEERHRQAMSAAKAGLWDLDLTTNHCFFSRRCYTLLGYEPERSDGHLESWLGLLHPADVEGVQRIKRDCLEGIQSNFQLEIRLKTKKGKWSWFLCKGKTLGSDASGRSCRVVGTMVDISEPKVVERMLRMEHDLLNLIAKTSPVGIMFVKRNGQFAFANPRAERILGIARGEILQRSYDSPLWQVSTHAGDPLAEGHLPLREVMEAGQTLLNACCAVMRPNGERVLLSMNAAPFLDMAGKVGGMVVILEDVSEQRQHEQVLADSERLLLETQRIAQLGSYVLDLSIDSWTCSRKLSEILGIDQNYPLNLRGHFEIVHPELRELFIENYLTAIVNERHFEMEYQIIRHNDQETRWVAECCELSYDGAGRRSRLIGTIQDITERKAAEEAIRSLNDDLDLRVIERTSQLAAAKQEIESFSYSVSHDLRAPLRHINNYSAILVEDFGSELPEPARNYLDRICTASSRMGTLIDDLLTLTRVGRTKMGKERIDLSTMVQDVATMLREADPGRVAEFVIQDGLWAEGDSLLVRLVLENLLGNALKYASHHHPARIEFGESRVEGKPAFFVKDDGVGFDMAYAGNLFQPFQRLHGAEFEGTGIGLATVRRIVERHGGKVWAAGKENEGATFYFTLPGVVRG